jgi:hypothetical protein
MSGHRSTRVDRRSGGTECGPDVRARVLGVAGHSGRLPVAARRSPRLLAAAARTEVTE